MKQVSVLIILLLFLPGYCLSQSGKFQKQINTQVWEPFIKAFNSRDYAAFKAVHSEEVIRVVRDSDQIFGAHEYLKPTPDSLKAQWSKWKRNIELRFIERIASEDEAFEVGYYKTTSVHSSTGERSISYGKFHVLLRRENGKWKILMDADANEGTNEEVFLSAESMEG